MNKPVSGFGLFIGGLFPKGREVDLDVVRGVAILLALGWHLNSRTGLWWFDAIQLPGLVFGWAGVDLFFVLSGFLVGRLIFREREKRGDFDYPRFFVRRALKLWPVLYMYLLFAVLFSDEPWFTFAPQIGFHVQNFLVPSQAHHLWSLAVEEHFYLAAGLILPFAMRRASTATIMGALIVLVVLPLLGRVSGYYAGASANDLQIQTQYRVDGLSAGVLLALISVRMTPVFDRMLSAKLVWGACVILGIAWLSVVPKDAPLGATVGFTVSWVTGAAFLMLLYKSGIDRWWRLPSLIIAFLGAYSYSLYIWHVAVDRLVEGRNLPIPEFVEITLSYVAAIAVAVAVTLLIERPILMLRDRWFAGHVSVMPSRKEVIPVEKQAAIS